MSCNNFAELAYLKWADKLEPRLNVQEDCIENESKC